MKLKTWIETDYKSVQWRVQRVTGVIARILTGRNSYLAFTRLTPLPPAAAAGWLWVARKVWPQAQVKQAGGRRGRGRPRMDRMRRRGRRD